MCVYAILLLNEIGEHCMQPITILLWLLDSAFTTTSFSLSRALSLSACLFNSAICLHPLHYSVLYRAYIFDRMVHVRSEIYNPPLRHTHTEIALVSKFNEHFLFCLPMLTINTPFKLTLHYLLVENSINTLTNILEKMVCCVNMNLAP